jgi:hypothetical protein
MDHFLTAAWMGLERKTASFPAGEAFPANPTTARPARFQHWPPSYADFVSIAAEPNPTLRCPAFIPEHFPQHQAYHLN